MEVYRVKTGSILPLGKQGENLVRQIQFDLSRWISTFGPGTVQLLHQRSGDETPYPVAVEQEGNLAVWTVTSADTAAAGTGRAELQYYVGDALAKSETWMTKVLPALGDASETPPEAQQGWVDQVLAQVAMITGMTAQAVELPAGSAPTADYTDGVLTIGIPLGGDVSEAQIAQAVAEYLSKNPIAETDPTVPAWAKHPDKPSYTADEVGAVSTESLPSAIDEALAKAKESGAFDGADGQPGENGADGYSPIANVTQNDNGTTITITDKNGTTTATVTNGKDGADGIPGKDGADGKDGAPGADGQDGITPTIGDNGNWYLGDTDTGKPSRGETGPAGADGRDGADGITPTIGANGNWYVGQTDTGVAATGPAGPALAVTNTASVGQTVKITAVDENGQPTEWEAVEFPAGGGGGYGEIVTADETILASGTIATGTVKDTYIDTGVTLAELRNWKYWTVEVKSSGQTTYWGVGFNRKIICRFQHSNIKFQIEWIDSAKTVARVFYASGTGYEYGEDDILNNVINSAMPVAHKQGAYAKVTETDDSALNINMFNDLTVDALWRVKGVLRYGD